MSNDPFPPTLAASLKAAYTPASVQINSMLKSLQFNPMFTSQQMAQVQAASNAAKALTMRVQALAQPLSNQYSQIVAAMSPIAEQVKQMQSLMDQFKVVFNVPDFSALWEAAQKSRSLLSEFVLLLAALGWTPALDVSVRDISMWVEMAEREGIEAVREPLDDFLTKLYDEAVLTEMLDEWREHTHLQPRMHILESAIKAHIRGEYVLSVPALIAQIEGFVADVYNHPGRMKQGEYKRYLLKEADEDHSVSEAVTSFVTKHLLEEFHRGKPVPDTSRHAILHGADVNYGTCATSLKVILFIDWLQSRTVDLTEVSA